MYRALKRAERIRTAPGFFEGGGYNPSSVNLRGSTSHLNVVDHAGNAVALTTTIGEGSGYYIPGTMIHMNNMLGEPYLLPSGLHSWIPDKRLSSMMAPAITVNEKGYPKLVMGTGGAGRIPFMLSQVWYNWSGAGYGCGGSCECSPCTFQ